MDCITFLVPALNEASGLGPTLDMIRGVAASEGVRPDILVVNDGSTDDTGAIAEREAAAGADVRVVHHDRPHGLGASYLEGVRLAKGEYVIMITGNNECAGDSIRSIVALRGKADIIIPYVTNMEDRPAARRIVARIYVAIMNAFTGIGLRYYNGTVLHRTEIIRSVPVSTGSYAYQAEALTRLIMAGHSFEEVGIRVNYRSHRTKAFRLRNIVSVGLFLLRFGSRCLALRMLGARPSKAPAGTGGR